jgi:hypothetical protein
MTETTKDVRHREYRFVTNNDETRGSDLFLQIASTLKVQGFRNDEFIDSL